MGIFILMQCRIFCLEVSLGAVPKNTKKAKKARNAKKAAGKVRREGGVGRHVPGNAESQGGPFNQVPPRRFTCRYIWRYVCDVCEPFWCCLCGRHNPTKR